MTRVHRVVQWTTGKSGGAAVRGMVGRPDLEIVGCYAWSADKIGREVGELCGIDPSGVVATDDIDVLLDLEPDCVTYLPYRPDFDQVEMDAYANEKMFRSMGIDLEPNDPAARATAEASCGSFKDQIPVIAKALGVDLDEVGFEVNFATADDTIDLGYMTIQKGRVSAFQGVISGIVGGEPRIQLQFVWKLGQGMTPEWPIEEGYRTEIHGEPGVRCRLEPLHAEHFDGTVTTAMPAVNAIARNGPSGEYRELGNVRLATHVKRSQNQ